MLTDTLSEMTEGIERLALLIKAVHRRGMRDMNAALSDLGLTAPQAEALTVLARAGSLSLRELGRLLIAEGGHPSRLVDRLVAAGLVSRDEAPDDRRRVTLRLTPAGRRLHEQAAERADAVSARYTTHLQGADVAAACDALAALLEGSDLAEVVQRRLDERAPAGAPGPPTPADPRLHADIRTPR
jgi:MarR family transcriptional regulator, organic hydroperoxide resistance regulator